MNEYGGLIEKIGRELGINKDENEDSVYWKGRVVYSIMGKMAMASLFDVLEDNQPVSMIHFKRRIEKIMHAYIVLYPELSEIMQVSSDKFAEEIYTIFLKSGYLYHTPNRILPPVEKRVVYNSLEFVRGAALNEKLLMSGLGTYSKKNGNDDINMLLEMFCIPKLNLKNIYDELLSRASWNEFNSNLHVDFLRIEPPYTRGYWKTSPDTNGKISLLRFGENGEYLYYLYQYVGNKVMVSKLPNWMVKGSVYRNISNCILAKYETLPTLNIVRRSDTVIVKQNYLLPPALYNFLMLYSWPSKFKCLANDFERIMKSEIFDVFHQILNIVGIEVVE